MQNVNSYVTYTKKIEIILEIFLKEGFILSVKRDKLWFNIELNQKFPYMFLICPYRAGNKHFSSSYELSHNYSWAIFSCSRGILVWPYKNEVV